jgi:carbon monoxide dehydrogenase subunit G
VSIKIEERFQIAAPVDRVWRYFIDPRQVVQCLPGAELTEVQDERTYLGRVKVKVGPVTAGYNGKATILEQNDAEHVVRVAGEGRETTGSGSAKMTMTSRLSELPGGVTEVHVVADVDVVGKIVQFGRGMIESVNKQLFRQFTECARAHLERPDGSAAVTTEGTTTASIAAAHADVASLGAPTVTQAARPAAPADATRTAPLAARAAPAVPVRILPLVLRAIWDAIRGLFGRRPAQR